MYSGKRVSGQGGGKKREEGENICKLFNCVPFITPFSKKGLGPHYQKCILTLSYLPYIFCHK